MKNPLPLLCLILLLSPGIASAQGAGLEEVVVTGSRIQARFIPATSIKRHADFLLLGVSVRNDSRDYKTRREEIHATLRAMLAAADRDRSIDLSVVRDDNVVLPLKLDDTTLDFSGSEQDSSLEATLSIKIPIDPSATSGAPLVDKLRNFVDAVKPVGRTEVSDDGETRVSVVNVSQYREPVVRLFAEDVRRITTALGGDYRVVARGLDQPIQWVRDGTLDVVIFVPYQYDVVPTTISSYAPGAALPRQYQGGDD